ncbi:hypothetical protein BT93_L5840 [Corymbia citriodora subsp. variegata]|uniref:Uncharacterized protein n=1 Tax=Corymbia citriodora subsp. variegata TaxID=360336 RepID=A0A8T0CEZ8_CORYI|nr:hypothetical protein BT93_L5840 [Corymbia citriodora subsp. variegata]
MEKGKQAREQIMAQNSASKCSVEVWPLDMSKYSSVLEFGDRVKSMPRLDALLANAGIDTSQFEIFEDHESTITVNVISTVLLALLAMPKLRETAKAQDKQTHLVLTGSVVHIFANQQYLTQPEDGQIFKSLSTESSADMADRYNLSKLVLLLAYRALAEEMSRDAPSNSIVLNFVNPGWCKTDLFRTNDGGMGGRIGLALIGRPAEVGSRTLVHGISTDASSHGKYMSECQVKPESSWARSDEGMATQKRVWAELVDILEKIKPGVTKF